MKWPWRGSWDFFHLLLAAQPSTFDIALLITGTIGAILAGLPFPLVGLLYGKLLDDLNQGCGDADPVTLSKAIGQKVVIVGAIGILNFLLIYTYMGAWTLFGERLTHRIKCAYFEALLRQEMAFFDTQPSGEAAARLEADIQAVQSGTSEKVGIYLTSLSYFVTAYAVAFTQDARLTMMLSALIPIYFLSSTLGNHFTVKFTKGVDEGVSKATSIAFECLSNITIIQAFGAAKQFEASFAGNLARIAPQATGKFVTAACQLGFLYLIAYTSNALAIWQGSIHIADSVHSQEKDFSFGKVYSVILLLLDASFVFTSISPFLTIFSTATVSYDKLAKVIGRNSAIDWSKSGNRMIPDQFEGDLELQNVTFNYPSRPETAVMTGLSLQMPAHKMTAIVGASGSGKSTIVGLLTRLYDPTEGAMLLDDIDIKSMDASTLRRNIAVVSQDPDLFDRSILENVVFGRSASFGGLPDGAFEELAEKVRGGLKIEDAAVGVSGMPQVLKLVEKALKQAGAWDFVSNSECGIATSVGPKGRRLSGGQRQRVALARAFFRRAPVIVLDEATASLDSANESLVQDTIAKELQGSTIVLITHRISSTKRADKVVVMRQGEIIETGSYEELIGAGGEFANMSRLQSFEREKQAKSAYAKKNEEASASAGRDADSLDELRLSTEDPLNEDEEAGLLGKGDKAPDAKAAISTLNVFKKIVSLARRQRRWIIAGAGFAFFVGLSHSIEAVLMGNTVEAVSVCQEESNIRHNGAKYGILFAIIGAAEFGANVMSSTSFGRVSESLLFKTRVLSLSALLDQSVEWHESEGRTPTSLLSIISTDATSLSGITGNVLGISFGVIVSLAAGVLISFIIAWRIAILLVATVPILLGSGFMRLTVLAKFQEKHAAAFTRSVGVAKEAIDNISTVAAYGLETESLAAYKRALREPYNATLRTVAYGNFWLALSYSIGNVIYALAYWWGAKNILEGYYTQAQFFTVLPALLVGAQGAGQLFSMVPDITRAGTASKRVLDLIQLAPRPVADLDKHKAASSEMTKTSGYSKVPLDEDPESGIELFENLNARFTEAKRLLTDPDDNDHPSPLSSARPLAVSLKGIRFSYPSRPESQVLKGLSIDIPAGSFAALVGPSGSGKSTVLALIERFFTPASGSVQVGDFGSQNLSALRDNVALVPQSAMLFDETIAFNLALGVRPGSPAPTRQDLETVCRQVALHDTIAALPEGYNTKLGPNGSRLSGGQRQRLAIARALLRRPRLLLLDEPTSALDPESERVCEQTLNEIRERGGVTVVVVAHRLHTVRNADCIYLVEGGKCTERGTHEELMVRSAHYRESVKSQTMDV